MIKKLLGLLLVFCALTAEVKVQGDLRLVGNFACQSPTLLELYVDGVQVDRKEQTSLNVDWRLAPFGKFKHTVRLDARCAGQIKRIVDTSYISSCSVFPKTVNLSKFNWCADSGIVDYWKTRQTDTKLLYNPKIKVGISNTLGGTVMQLYGADRDLNLITEHGGAGIQLSLWGYPGDNSVTNGSYGFACQAENTENGVEMRKILNPIQASGKGCWFEDLIGTTGNEEPTNDVTTKENCGDKCWRITKSNPYNFTRSLNLAGLVWIQTAQVFPDGYLSLAYNVAYEGVPLSLHPQEIPGMFWALGTNPKIYWLGYRAPYAETPAYLSETLAAGETVLSNALNAYVQVTRVLAQPWYSICNAEETDCVTVIFGANNLVKQVNIRRAETGSVYASAMGYFALTPGSRYDNKLFIFPTKYDRIPSSLRDQLMAQ